MVIEGVAFGQTHRGPNAPNPWDPEISSPTFSATLHRKCGPIPPTEVLRMTKADIVQAVYTKLGGFSKKEAADLVDQVFDSMKETLGRGEKIKISGFGNFVLRDKRQRQGRNPQTGEPIVITARRVLNFKASQLLKQALNEGPTAAWPEGAAAAGAQNGQSSSGDGHR